MTKLKVFSSKIIAGLLDALLPNVKESIKLTESQFIQEKPSYKIDYVRLITSLITFAIIVASFFDWIDLAQLLEILNVLNPGK